MVKSSFANISKWEKSLFVTTPNMDELIHLLPFTFTRPTAKLQEVSTTMKKAQWRRAKIRCSSPTPNTKLLKALCITKRRGHFQKWSSLESFFKRLISKISKHVQTLLIRKNQPDRSLEQIVQLFYKSLCLIIYPTLWCRTENLFSLFTFTLNAMVCIFHLNFLSNCKIVYKFC